MFLNAKNVSKLIENSRKFIKIVCNTMNQNIIFRTHISRSFQKLYLALEKSRKFSKHSNRMMDVGSSPYRGHSLI